MNHCPSLILMVCLRCQSTHDRKDGRGVFNGTTVESHGFCTTCASIIKAEWQEQIEKEK